MNYKNLDIKGMVFENVYRDEHTYENDAIVFVATTGEKYVLTHEQDCCESVYIEDIDGDLKDLIGQPLEMAEEAYKCEDCETYSYYRFATIKGYVTIRFYGSSNGYYSESADLYLVVRGRLSQDY